VTPNTFKLKFHAKNTKLILLIFVLESVKMSRFYFADLLKHWEN